MPPKSKRRVTEEDSDGGIVDDKDESTKPRHKRTKVDKPAKSTSGGEVPGGGALDDDGAEYWEVRVSMSSDWHSRIPADEAKQLSKSRRVTVNEYRGKYMINLREYFSKDGQMLPGKKVCSLLLATLDRGIVRTMPDRTTGNLTSHRPVLCAPLSLTSY